MVEVNAKAAVLLAAGLAVVSFFSPFGSEARGDNGECRNPNVPISDQTDDSAKNACEYSSAILNSNGKKEALPIGSCGQKDPRPQGTFDPKTAGGYTGVLSALTKNLPSGANSDKIKASLDDSISKFSKRFGCAKPIVTNYNWLQTVIAPTDPDGAKLKSYTSTDGSTISLDQIPLRLEMVRKKDNKLVPSILCKRPSTDTINQGKYDTCMKLQAKYHNDKAGICDQYIFFNNATDSEKYLELLQAPVVLDKSGNEIPRPTPADLEGGSLDYFGKDSDPKTGYAARITQNFNAAECTSEPDGVKIDFAEVQARNKKIIEDQLDKYISNKGDGVSKDLISCNPKTEGYWKKHYHQSSPTTCVGTISTEHANNESTFDAEAMNKPENSKFKKCIDDAKKAGLKLVTVNIGASASQLNNSLEKSGCCPTDFHCLSEKRTNDAKKVILNMYPGDTPKVTTDTLGDNGDGSSGLCPYDNKNHLLPGYQVGPPPGEKRKDLDPYKFTNISMSFAAPAQTETGYRNLESKMMCVRTQISCDDPKMDKVDIPHFLMRDQK